MSALTDFDPRRVYFDTPVRMKAIEDPSRPDVMRMVMDVSARELMMRHHADLLRDVVGRMSQAIASKITDEMMGSGNLWDQLIKEAIKEEIRAQVKDEIANRIDGIVEDVMENL